MSKVKKLLVKVKPNARENSLRQFQGATWIAEVKASPKDGKANRAVIELIAKQFKVTKSRVSIKSGKSGLIKLIQLNI
ncbi:MAG: DUF167 domain-containing protein [Rhodospirillales bacterium]|nr:DUF167 domain-containing protein [Rhodospirillales bacterium]